MELSEKPMITVEIFVNQPLAKVWQYWTIPEHIMKWNHASADWYTPYATNDLQEGGIFNYRMTSKDHKYGFDFNGVYDKIVPLQLISYTLGDGRKVRISFTEVSGNTKICEYFEPENVNPPEMQKTGWQAILNNFKLYLESGS